MIELLIVRSKSDVPVNEIKKTFKDKLCFIRQIKLSSTEFKYILEISFESTNGKSDDPALSIVLSSLFSGIISKNYAVLDKYDPKDDLAIENRKKKYQNIHIINSDGKTMGLLENIVKQLFIGGLQIIENEFWISVTASRFEDNYHLFNFLLNSTKIICKDDLDPPAILEIAHMPEVEEHELTFRNILKAVFQSPEKEPKFLKITVQEDIWHILFNDQKDVERVIPRIHGGKLSGNIIQAHIISPTKPKLNPKNFYFRK